jgi:hypothetical protein
MTATKKYAAERLMKVVLAPVVSEKSTRLADKNRQYVFRVADNATKPEVKAAIELLFKTKVQDVTVAKDGFAVENRGGTIDVIPRLVHPVALPRRGIHAVQLVVIAAHDDAELVAIAEIICSAENLVAGCILPEQLAGGRIDRVQRPVDGADKNLSVLDQR